MGKSAVKVFSVIAICFVFMGSCLSNNLVWELTDMFNNLMVIPNSLALFALSSVVVGHVDTSNLEDNDEAEYMVQTEN